MLTHFKFTKFRFVLQAEENISLPEYKGAVFRGGFGYAFRKIVCIQRANKDCTNCMIQKSCIYSYIFETPLPEDSEVLRLYKTVPHPFVLEPPLEDKRIIEKDNETEFNLILIGKAIDYLPYFIFTFNELGKTGIGRNRSKFTLKRVESITNDNSRIPIYNHEEQTIVSGYPVIDTNQLMVTDQTNEIELKFITPLRVKFDGKITSNIKFHIILRNLLRRISSLSIFHCGKEFDCDYTGLIEEAKKIETTKTTLKWYDWERFSTRQKQKMNLGGVIGSITVNGNLNPFLQLLRLGEYIHVGKNTSFGLGKYEIIQ